MYFKLASSTWFSDNNAVDVLKRLSKKIVFKSIGKIIYTE